MTFIPTVRSRGGQCGLKRTLAFGLDEVCERTAQDPVGLGIRQRCGVERFKLSPDSLKFMFLSDARSSGLFHRVLEFQLSAS